MMAEQGAHVCLYATGCLALLWGSAMGQYFLCFALSLHCERSAHGRKIANPGRGVLMRWHIELPAALHRRRDALSVSTACLRTEQCAPPWPVNVLYAAVVLTPCYQLLRPH